MNTQPNFKTTFFKLITAGLVLLLAAPVFAQKLENTLLWKVEGEGIKPSWVFGTIHIMPQADFEVHPKVSEAIGKADQMALEIDMSDPGIQGKMMQNAAMKGNTTLKELLDEETYVLLDTMLQQSLGASIVFMNRFKPLVVSTFLIPRLIDGQPANYEMVLVQEAKKQGMSVKGLEALEDQMAVFDLISYQSQADDLADMIHKEEEMKEMYTTMVGHYKSENLNALYKMMVDYMEDEEERRVMLDNRNINWIPVIKEYSADVSTFYGVGAAHLPGEKGLIKLLRDAGYKVTPVMN